MPRPNVFPDWRHWLRSGADKQFAAQLQNVLGISPGRLALYRTALAHRSVKGAQADNNERLEYLGDAVLSSVVADYLYKRYPLKGEGFLTEMRSKMVNRQQLNELAMKIGLHRLTQFNRTDGSLRASQIFGNTLEAVVGAVYLDKGYAKTHGWVLTQLIIPHLYVADLEKEDINLKNKLISWANRQGKHLDFHTIEEKQEGNRRLFTIGVMVDGEEFTRAKAFNKKHASHEAAKKALEKIGQSVA